MPPRRSDHDKRRLQRQPLDANVTAELLASARYVGSAKHKLHPHLYGLPPFIGERGDATLCDSHAGFEPQHMMAIPAMLRRGILAGLIGTGRLLWTVADNGWIFECRITNVGQSEYHGYPVRKSEPIGELIYRRYAGWASTDGSREDKRAAEQCKALYGFRP
jgi:hypothetical protein